MVQREAWRERAWRSIDRQRPIVTDRKKQMHSGNRNAKRTEWGVWVVVSLDLSFHSLAFISPMMIRSTSMVSDWKFWNVRPPNEDIKICSRSHPPVRLRAATSFWCAKFNWTYWCALQKILQDVDDVLETYRRSEIFKEVGPQPKGSKILPTYTNYTNEFFLSTFQYHVLNFKGMILTLHPTPPLTPAHSNTSPRLHASTDRTVGLGTNPNQWTHGC